MSSDSLIWQSVRTAIGLGTRAIEEVRALKSAPPQAHFPLVRAWEDRVHYEGAVVACGGATWQATRDTGREPPHEDWALLAAPGATGADAYAGEVRGQWQPHGSYRKGDLVALNGSEWRARHDDPGPLPGAGWALAAKRGSRGEQGERGEPGKPGADIAAWQIDGYRITPVMSDGRRGPSLDLQMLFEQYHREASA